MISRKPAVPAAARALSGGGIARLADAAGFTMVELLVVMVIILILMALSVPSVISILQSSQITQGGNIVSTQFDLARQLAVSQNQPITVRLIMPSSSTHFSALALLKAPPATATGTQATTLIPINSPSILPDPIIMDAGTANASTTLSTITQFQSPPVSAGSTDPSLGRFGTAYKHVDFVFNPNGSTSLLNGSPSLPANSPCFVTIHNVKDGDGISTVPKNYYTVQVDPSSGRTSIFTP